MSTNAMKTEVNTVPKSKCNHLLPMDCGQVFESRFYGDRNVGQGKTYCRCGEDLGSLVVDDVFLLIKDSGCWQRHFE